MTATSVVPPPMSTIRLPVGSPTGQTGTDRGGHGLLDESGPACAGVQRRVANGSLFNFSDATWDADEHSWTGDQADAIVHLVHEVLDHLLGHVEVADDAVAQRPHRDDVGRRAAEHALCLCPDGQHALRALVDRDDARLADDDAAVAHVDERVRSAEIDADIAREHAEEGVEHSDGRVLGRVEWGPASRVHRRAATEPAQCIPRARRPPDPTLSLPARHCASDAPHRASAEPGSRASMPELSRRTPDSSRATSPTVHAPSGGMWRGTASIGGRRRRRRSRRRRRRDNSELRGRLDGRDHADSACGTRRPSGGRRRLRGRAVRRGRRARG